MHKLSMCRICLVKNVRMFVVANKNLQEIYEKLSDTPLVTEDRRPMLACFFCCNRLKQCCRLQQKCLKAEKLFARILNEDYEVKPLVDQGHSELNGYIISPTVHISISDEYPVENGHVFNGNLPADREGQDDIFELMKKHQSESEEEFQDIEYLDCYSDEEYLPTQLQSDSGDDLRLTEFKTESEEEVSKKKRRAKKTTRAASATKPKLDTRRAKTEDSIATQQMKTKQPVSKIIRNAKNRVSRPVLVTGFKKLSTNSSLSNNFNKRIRIHTGEKPYKCDVCQASFNERSFLRNHIRMHTGEKPFKCKICQRSFTQKGNLRTHIRLHTGEKPYKCDLCQRSFTKSSHLTLHIRIHTGEKPYKCDKCWRRFTDSSSLTRHIRIHSGVKPYKCDICLRSFTQKGTLKQHSRVHTR